MERKQYMRNDGFPLVADVGHQFMHDQMGLEVTRVSEEDLMWEPINANPSAGALAVVSHDLWQRIDDEAPRVVYSDYYAERYGITATDKGPGNQFIFKHGLGDLEFTWHTAPAVANGIVQTFVDKNYITEQQQHAMTLGDWADMIGSYWFSDVMHDLALTGNGIYVSFGKEMMDYTSDGFTKFLSGNNFTSEPFDIVSQYEVQTDRTYLSVEVSDEFRAGLRENMKQANSPGCPVARRNVSLSLDLVNNNPHVENLVNRGDLVHLGTNEEKGRARFAHAYTPIDRGLDALAHHLDTYDARFGTPYWELKARDRVTHRPRPRTNVLVQRGNRQFAPISA